MRDLPPSRRGDLRLATGLRYPHRLVVGARGTLSIRTVHFRLAAESDAGAINVWPARIIRSVFLGDLTQVHLDWGGQEIVVRQIGPPVAAAGEAAYLNAAPSQCALLESGR